MIQTTEHGGIGFSLSGRKFVRGETFYLVKFLGWAKPQWEPEENVDVSIVQVTR